MEKELNRDMQSLVHRAKTRQILADEFGICVKTLNRRIKKANIKVEPGVLLPKTLKIIYEAFGVPTSSKKF
jgi:hypothetical protein